MRRFLLLISVLCASTIMMWAGQIDREQAQRQAQQFLGQRGKNASLRLAETQLSKARARGTQTPDYYYVFNVGQNEGFVIVSGDDRTPEILGYADKGAFDTEQMADGLKALLASYAQQIASLQTSNSGAYVQKASHPAISPMLQTTWNQQSPYNDNCKFTLADGSPLNAVTGCVATMMAQVMYYHKYPAQVLDNIPSYNINYTNAGGTYTFSGVASGTVIDWANMKTNYTGEESEAEKQAVANLMLYCGKSVNMLYNGTGSSASVSKVPDALKNYFGYYKGITYIRRANYSADDWDNLIYNELAENRPVMLGGQDAATEPKNGHAFVCDGYDGDGKYHINWGWGGLSDGFYTLSDLTPEHQGTGGGNGGYNFTQEAVIGVKKDDGSFAESVRATTTSFTLTNGSEFSRRNANAQFLNVGIEFKVENRLANDNYVFENALALYKNGSLQKIILQWEPGQLLRNYIYTLTATIHPDYTPGVYEIHPVSREQGTSQWLKNSGSENFYAGLLVTDTELKIYVGQTPEAPVPEVSDADRTELANIYAALKSDVQTKQSAVANYENTVKVLEQAVAQLSARSAELDAKTAAAKQKLTNENLTEEQKAAYTQQLAAIETDKAKTDQNLKTVMEALNAATTSLATQKSSLSSLLSQIQELSAAVSGITTKSALNASKDKAANLKSDIDAINIDKVAADLTAIENACAAIVYENLETSLAEVEAKIDADIKAQTPEVSKEERAALNEALAALKSDAEKKNNAIVQNDEQLADVKTKIEGFTKELEKVDTQISAVEALMADELLSSEQRENYQKQLTPLKTLRNNYSSALYKLQETYDDLVKKNTALKTALNDVNTAITQAQNDVASVDTKVKLESMQGTVKTITADLTKIDTEAVAASITALYAEIGKQPSASEITDSLTLLDASIREAIEEAKKAKEEEDKQQQEAKLAEAKTAVDKLAADQSTQLTAALATLADNKSVLQVLKENLPALDESIQKLTEQADSLKAILAKESVSEVRTRSNGLTDEQRADYQAKLDNIQNVVLPELTAQREALMAEIEKLETQISADEQQIADWQAQIDTATKAATEATTIAEVETQQKALEAIQTEIDQLQAVSLAEIKDAISAQQSTLLTILSSAQTAVKEAQAVVKDADETWTNIDSIGIDKRNVQGRYDLNGRPVDENYRGIVIIKMNNGQTKTIFKR